MCHNLWEIAKLETEAINSCLDAKVSLDAYQKFDIFLTSFPWTFFQRFHLLPNPGRQYSTK